MCLNSDEKIKVLEHCQNNFLQFYSIWLPTNSLFHLVCVCMCVSETEGGEEEEREGERETACLEVTGQLLRVNFHV